jgi:SAM-dependent methyltransferase
MTLKTYRASLQILHELLKKRLPKKNTRIYEAGGGSTSFIRLDFLHHAHITVVDIDEVQLKNNKYADAKILGDIQKHAFPPNSFDLIVCYNVIEHLEAPDRAVKLFSEALAPEGLLVIGAPNPKSFSGWVTKATPHWFHVLYYRLVLGDKLAGQPGHVPFRVVYHPVVTPAALMRFCESLGLQVIHFREYEGDQYERIKEKNPIIGSMLNVIVGAANLLWQRDLKNGDYHMILEKRPVISNKASLQ